MLALLAVELADQQELGSREKSPSVYVSHVKPRRVPHKEVLWHRPGLAVSMLASVHVFEATWKKKMDDMQLLWLEISKMAENIKILFQ